MSIDHSLPRYQGLDRLAEQRAWKGLETELAEAAVKELVEIETTEPIEESNK